MREPELVASSSTAAQRVLEGVLHPAEEAGVDGGLDEALDEHVREQGTAKPVAYGRELGGLYWLDSILVVLSLGHMGVLMHAAALTSACITTAFLLAPRRAGDGMVRTEPASHAAAGPALAHEPVAQAAEPMAAGAIQVAGEAGTEEEGDEAVELPISQRGLRPRNRTTEVVPVSSPSVARAPGGAEGGGRTETLGAVHSEESTATTASGGGHVEGPAVLPALQAHWAALGQDGLPASEAVELVLGLVAWAAERRRNVQSVLDAYGVPLAQRDGSNLVTGLLGVHVEALPKGQLYVARRESAPGSWSTMGLAAAVRVALPWVDAEGFAADVVAGRPARGSTHGSWRSAGAVPVHELPAGSHVLPAAVAVAAPAVTAALVPVGELSAAARALPATMAVAMPVGMPVEPSVGSAGAGSARAIEAESAGGAPQGRLQFMVPG